MYGHCIQNDKKNKFSFIHPNILTKVYSMKNIKDFFFCLQTKKSSNYYPLKSTHPYVVSDFSLVANQAGVLKRKIFATLKHAPLKPQYFVNPSTDSSSKSVKIRLSKQTRIFWAFLMNSK